MWLNLLFVLMYFFGLYPDLMAVKIIKATRRYVKALEAHVGLFLQTLMVHDTADQPCQSLLSALTKSLK